MNIKGHHLDAQKIKTSTMKKSIDSGVVLKVVPGTSQKIESEIYHQRVHCNHLSQTKFRK